MDMGFTVVHTSAAMSFSKILVVTLTICNVTTKLMETYGNSRRIVWLTHDFGMLWCHHATMFRMLFFLTVTSGWHLGQMLVVD